MEVRLREWIIDCRDKCIVVTRRMVVSRARLWDRGFAHLTEEQRDRWWRDFWRCQGVTTRNNNSFSRGGCEEFLANLTRHYRANIHCAFRRCCPPPPLMRQEFLVFSLMLAIGLRVLKSAPWIPKKLVAPTVPKHAPKLALKRGKQPAANLRQPIRPSLSLMGNMCSCSRLC